MAAQARTAAPFGSAIILALAPLWGCSGEIQSTVGSGAAPGDEVIGVAGQDGGAVSPPAVSVMGGDGGAPGAGVRPPATKPPAGGGPPVGRPGGTCTGGAIPADVENILKTRCQACHASPPLAGVPAALVNPDDFLRPGKLDPTRTVGELVVVRIGPAATMRMPPAPASPLPVAEVQTLQTWLLNGMPLAGCSPGAGPAPPPPDAGAGRPSLPPTTGPDPFAAPAVCTSRSMWTGGTRGSSMMQPGEACIACHRRNEGPGFAVAGTVYPTGHDPRLCNGVDGTGNARGATVVVVDSDNRSVTASVNGAGNFRLGGRLTPPLRAKVVFMGRERLMINAVPTGDCNSCHTPAGTTSVTGALKAPGRILLP